MTKGVNNQPLGDYIHERRLSRKLDIRSAAEHSGFHESYWRKLEAGQYEAPDPKHLRVIAETIGCPLQDLYALCGYDTPTELPTLGPYLRATSDLTAEDIAVIERIFHSLADETDERRAA